MRSGVMTSCSEASSDAGDAVERFHRQILAFGEILDFLIGRPRDEIGGRGAHHQQPGLEIAAGVGDGSVAMHAVEGVADLDIAGHIGEPDGEEADHRDDGQHDDAGADRQLGEHFWHEHGDRSGILAAAPHPSGISRKQTGKWLRFGKKRSHIAAFPLPSWVPRAMRAGSCSAGDGGSRDVGFCAVHA